MNSRFQFEKVTPANLPFGYRWLVSKGPGARLHPWEVLPVDNLMLLPYTDLIMFAFIRTRLDAACFLSTSSRKNQIIMVDIDDPRSMGTIVPRNKFRDIFEWLEHIMDDIREQVELDPGEMGELG